MVDPVERRRQVRVEHPPPQRVRAPCDVEDGLDRVMATTAGPKSVGPRLEPCLPLRLQCVDHARLQHAIDDHRNPEWAALPACFRDVHPLDRTGQPRFGAALHPVGQFSLRRWERHHLPVDARGLAASIDLRHPTHAQQRVRPGTQHQLLQTTDPFQVPYLRGREDPLPQTPYVVLSGLPVNSKPVQDVVLRSVQHSDTRRRRRRCRNRCWA
jgi:hypothetical protein